MKKIFITKLLLLSVIVCSAQPGGNYKTLDATNPIVFGGTNLIYQGKTITLGPKAFFIDGQFTDEEAAKYPYVFNTVNEAAKHLSDGTEGSPMVLYIAPYVYWIDDPDDPEIRVPVSGTSPYGLIIECEWLRFYGLSENAENVVLACNRGQTLGSKGNFTMFRFSGQGTSSENITFGNYCNIDLVYPLKPVLGREKRASAIVQAQLIFCNGDKIVARNTRFVSRLNLMPFLGGKRVLFDRCHFESTDDALNGTAIYLNCTLDFYSGKPFGGTSGTGAIFFNCDIRSFVRGNQYFVKMGGQMAVLDTRLTTETATYVGWKDNPPAEMRNYQYNFSINGKPAFIGKNDPESTIDMTDKSVLDAYLFVYNGKVVYNTYNLLCGNDDWDPMGVKNIVLAAEKANGVKYTMLPVQLLISPTRTNIETGKNDAKLSVRVNRFGNYASTGEKISWEVAPEFKSSVELKASEDGMTCLVIPSNTNDELKQVIVTASTPSGLKGASVLNVSPSKLDPPKFSMAPDILEDNNGKLLVEYKLDTKYDDQSLVTWFRCSDAKGSNPIEIEVSRMNIPKKEYELTSGDAGYFIMATISPKHIRCDAGEPVAAVTKKPISVKEIRSDTRILFTDFSNLSTGNQPEIIPGFWTLYNLELTPDGRFLPSATERDAWRYGEGSDGGENEFGLLQTGRYARLGYTPVGNEFSDMNIKMKVAPMKTAGQGFSIADLFMDILIKFDMKTMTGYALRFIRTTKYHDAVDCLFVKYENGNITEISQPVSTTCYRTPCIISIEVKGNKIIAHAESPAEYYLLPGRPEVVTEVNIETEIVPDKSGGFGINYAGGSTAVIKELKVEWE